MTDRIAYDIGLSFSSDASAYADSLEGHLALQGMSVFRFEADATPAKNVLFDHLVERYSRCYKAIAIVNRRYLRQLYCFHELNFLMQHSKKVQHPYLLIVAVDGLLDSLASISSTAKILDAQKLSLSQVIEHCLVFACGHAYGLDTG